MENGRKDLPGSPHTSRGTPLPPASPVGQISAMCIDFTLETLHHISSLLPMALVFLKAPGALDALPAAGPRLETRSEKMIFWRA